MSKLKVEAKSQFLNRPLDGFVACTPTALCLAYRFLKLAKSKQLRLDEGFLQDQLAKGIGDGGKLNAHMSGTFRRKSAKQVLTLIAALDADPNDAKTVPHLKSNPYTFAVINPVGHAHALAEDFFLPDVLHAELQKDADEDVAIILTCKGHTTLLMRLNDQFFFIDSAHTLLKSVLEVHDELDSVITSMHRSWGDKAIEVNLTRVCLSVNRQLSQSRDSLWERHQCNRTFSDWVQARHEQDLGDPRALQLRQVEYLTTKAVIAFFDHHADEDRAVLIEQLHALCFEPDLEVEDQNLICIQNFLRGDDEVVLQLVQDIIQSYVDGSSLSFV